MLDCGISSPACCSDIALLKFVLSYVLEQESWLSNSLSACVLHCLPLLNPIYLLPFLLKKFWKRIKGSGSEEWLLLGLNKTTVWLCGFLHLHYGRRAIFFSRNIAKSQVASKQFSALPNIFMYQIHYLNIFFASVLHLQCMLMLPCKIQMLEAWMH